MQRYFIYLVLFLGLKAFAAVLVILYAGIGLGPDEAQYWTWSQQLDWGYYSKPPGIAWEIWTGTSLFGNTELGVRSMAVVIGTLIPAGIFFLAKACRLAPPTCFWAGIAMACAPLGMMASILSITDGGMIVFWTAACIYLIHDHKKPNYLFLGLLICGGALFKWPIYVLWVFIAAFAIWQPTLRSWKILLGISVSLLALLPSVYWNASHQWATFRHVLATISGGHGQSASPRAYSGNFWDFIGAQALLLFPILFILWLMALSTIIKARKYSTSDRFGLLFCGAVSGISVAVGAILSLMMKMQGNWAIFAYPTACVVLSWYACEWKPAAKKWLVGGIGLSVLLCGILFSVPYLQSHNPIESMQIPYKISPFRHNVGWNRLGEELKAAGYHSDTDFLFGDKYQTVSILSFYGPNQHRAYFFNLLGTRRNQFSYWPGMDQAVMGKRGFFVVTENSPRLDAASELVHSYEEKLAPYFSQVHFLGIKPLFLAYGKMVKGALIFECKGFIGHVPKDPELY